MADYTPVFDADGDPFTLTTSAAVTGGQVLVVSGSGTVGPSAGASAVVIGVAAMDAASGARVTVYPLDAVHEITASGAITAGDGIVSAASGQVATAVVGTAAAAGTLLGIALTTVTSGNKVRFVGRN